MAFEYAVSDDVLLELDKVNLSFGSNLVLRDVNAKVTRIDRADVPCGRVICFLGPSGIGKTQLSRIIAGLQAPTSGSVRLKAGPTGRGLVGMVPQFYPMFDYATVAGNLMIAGHQGGLDPKETNEKASSLIETFGLRDHLAKYPKELSGGTKQRVAIARQLMCASNYMVMDEPFSGLDPISKAKTMDAIIKLSQLDANHVIIVVTHAVTEGLTIADTVWMMGYEKGEDGKNIAGARLVSTFDLAALGYAWHPDLEREPAFLSFAREVKDRFNTLR